jgi:predicted aldo/keto reductase-like oxidoreductase
MEYTTLGKTGLKVSRLGFGCMRLPMKDGRVDRELTTPLLRRAVELGITYFDTAVMYCGGDSQRAMGEALEDLRDRIVLSTKNHHYDKKDKAGWWKNLEDSLKFLRTDCIDVYNFHGLNYEAWEGSLVGEDGLFKEALKAKEQGMVSHLCHSFHGSLESLKRVVDLGIFESVTLQYNLLDRSLEEGIAYAREHNVGVTVMGPVGGGRLGYPSEKASELVGEVKSTPELALRFVLSNPGVCVALSGMSNMKQLEENVATVSKSGGLSEEDHKRITAAVQERKKLSGLYCTGCNYCMPCPEGVDIPANFEIVNLERVFGLTEHARSRYAALAGKAALCRLCGKCVEKCPQDLDIPARLSETVAALDERAGSLTGWSEVLGAESAPDEMLNVRLRYHLKNFTGQAYDKVKVTVQSHREDQVQPGAFQLSGVKPYARRHKDLEVLVRPPLETLSLDAHIRFDGAETVEQLHFVMAAAARGKRFGLKSRPAGVIHVPGAVHPAQAAPQKLKGHGFDFAVCYDDEHLYVWADVDDDLLGAAKEEVQWYTKADRLIIFLDGRKPAAIGRGGYEAGVNYVAIHPSAKKGEPPQVRVHNRAEVQTAFDRTPTGYRVDCAIPWKAFSQVEGRPRVIGFDVVQASYTEEGEDQVRVAWTGRERQERESAGFGKLLLV